MLEQLKALLMKSYDGAPVWGWLAGAVLLHLEWFLPRTKLLKANSTLELVPNILLGMGGKFIPGLNVVLAKLGSGMPAVKATKLPLTPPEPPKEAA